MGTKQRRKKVRGSYQKTMGSGPAFYLAPRAEDAFRGCRDELTGMIHDCDYYFHAPSYRYRVIILLSYRVFLIRLSGMPIQISKNEKPFKQCGRDAALFDLFQSVSILIWALVDSKIGNGYFSPGGIVSAI